ncbi:MAG: hypothetical protein U5K76_15505 [Woeseiaceae bacterium]|nr:hypothetical protein [Woeseiaceae bacterium]
MKNAFIARTGAIVAVTIGLSACGTLYELEVSAQKATDALPGETYVILSGDPDLALGSAEFNEYASQLEKALDARGYVRVPGDSLADAAIAVYVSADIGAPKKTYHTVSRGVYEAPYLESTQAAARSTSNQGDDQSGGATSKPTVLDRPPQEELVGYKKNSFATTV